MCRIAKNIFSYVLINVSEMWCWFCFRYSLAIVPMVITLNSICFGNETNISVGSEHCFAMNMNEINRFVFVDFEIALSFGKMRKRKVCDSILGWIAAKIVFIWFSFQYVHWKSYAECRQTDSCRRKPREIWKITFEHARPWENGDFFFLFFSSFFFWWINLISKWGTCRASHLQMIYGYGCRTALLPVKPCNTNIIFE